MARPKGSKNKSTEQKVAEIIEEVKELKADEAEKAEVIDELEDLLSSPKEEETVIVSSDGKGKLVGYHPITGAEIWI